MIRRSTGEKEGRTGREAVTRYTLANYDDRAEKSAWEKEFHELSPVALARQPKAVAARPSATF